MTRPPEPPKSQAAVLVATYLLGNLLFFIFFAALFNGSKTWPWIALVGYFVLAGVISAPRPAARRWVPWLLVIPAVPWVTLLGVASVREGLTESAFVWAGGFCAMCLLSFAGTRLGVWLER